VKNSQIRPIRRRRLSSTQIAALIQLVIAGALIVALSLLMWRFFQAADRLGGVKLFIYLPVAMVGFLAMAIFRFVQAYRMYRRGDRER